MRNRQTLEKALERKEAIRRNADEWAQKANVKQTARARVLDLLDANSFVELDALASGSEGESVVAGYGTADGRPVYVFAQEYAANAGAVTVAHAQKMRKVLSLARKCGAPVVGVFDSAGGWVADGAPLQDAYAGMCADIARLSGVVPTIGVILGDCTGAAALMPALMDIVIASEPSTKWAAVGASVSSEELGVSVNEKELSSASAHARRGGAAISSPTEKDALAKARALLALLPDNNLDSTPESEPAELNRSISDANPESPDTLISSLLDTGSAVGLHEPSAPGAKTVLGKLGGQSCGVVSLTGYIGTDECDKAARFVRLCDCYNIPLVFLVNVTGLAAVKPDDSTSLIKAAARLTYSLAEATVPSVRVVTADAIGAGYSTLGGRSTADIVYAWPGAVISPISPEAAAALYYKDEIASSKGDPKSVRQEIADKYAAEKADGVAAAEQGLVDDVINPADTRRMVISALSMLESKRDQNPPKKHGNLPL